MLEADKKEWLINQVTEFSRLLNEGRYDEIDLSIIEEEASELARNFEGFITDLQTAGSELGSDSHDVSEIQEQLSHVVNTTESSVKTVIEHSEMIMNDAGDIRNVLLPLKDKFTSQTEYTELEEKISRIQDSSFLIMTSLEFEDINRQMIEKINLRLNQYYGNLVEVLFLLKLKDKFEKKDQSFINEMKGISDPTKSTKEKQDMIDELFKEFGFN